MPVQLNSPGWKISTDRASRGATRDATPDIPGLPREFLAETAKVAEEVVLAPAPTTRGRALGGEQLDFSYDLAPGQAAVLALRHASGALTFHLPVQSTSRGVTGPSVARFQVTVPQRATRGLVGQAIKATVIAVGKLAVDKAVSLVLPTLAATLEKTLWERRGLREGWLGVTKDTLASGTLEPGTPVSPARSLLFIHGTFSDAASAYRALATSSFFDRVKDLYGDRMFAFNHFTISRTPEENARALLKSLPEQATTFDVVTHSRGGLVLRTLVERASAFGPLARRFALGRAVLVASPNEGTPLATPQRWNDTIGWLANLLEMFPDNPFTTGSALVANGLVWMAHHASGDLPGLRSMDADGPLIAAIQGPPGPPADAYSALVSNYHPTGALLPRLLDAGMDQFFGSANDLVVPSEGGWRIDASRTSFIPASRIGCFGPGGNLAPASVSHVDFFSQPDTVEFLVNALSGQRQPLVQVDPSKSLPDRRLVRGAAAGGPAPSADAGAPAPPGRRRPRQDERDASPMLQITVTNGDLTFEPEALLIGHYASTRLTGSEYVMDMRLGGAMGRALDVGLYPRSVGSHQIFINTVADLRRGSAIPRPNAVIVVGLGREGTLRSADLVHTVRQAVVAWAQRLAEKKAHAPDFALASTLMASGGMGITAGEAARLIAQGVYEANALLDDNRGGKRPWPHVRHLRLVELYLDRATEAWRALRMQAAATPDRYGVDAQVRSGTGPLERPSDSGYRGADYDFISVDTTEGDGQEPLISYTLDTRRARSEVRGQRAQSRLLRELISTASNDQNHDQQIGRTLFNLLVPVELEAYLAGTGEVHMELDTSTAAIPWELLDTTSDENPDQRPWAIRTKLLRKLRVKNFRERVVDADADAAVLVVGEPECPPNYPRLYGARHEAVVVKTCLTAPGALDQDLVTALVSDDPSKAGADARTVVGALFEKPWRIVHIAGHGAPPDKAAPRGVVLSHESFLGPNEIRAMRVAPELVFVNCCHLASGDNAQLLNPRYDRAGFASGVAGALIDIGVRCVIAAGWAVDDDGAAAFAEEFYASLLRGSRFIDAVGHAREAAYRRSPQSNTWAAYQCYGDPDWAFRRRAKDANQFTAALSEDFSDVGSAVALKLALARSVVQSKFQDADPRAQLASLRTLEEMFGKTWGTSGSVAELYGEAFVQAGDLERGMDWYQRAVTAPDGLASMKAAEQLSNVRARLSWDNVRTAFRHRDETQAQSRARGQSPRARAASRRALRDAERTCRESLRLARSLTSSALALLKTLRTIEKTLERESLVGSLYKRRALIEAAAGRRRQADQALRQMKAAYDRAEALGRKAGASDVYYPASNRLAADVALNAGRRGWRHLDPDVLRTVQEGLKAKSGADADFWSVVGDIELKQYVALADGSFGRTREHFEHLYQDLHKRVAAPHMWSSVYDTAYLVLGNVIARQPSRRDRDTAGALLALLQSFAHPGEPDR